MKYYLQLLLFACALVTVVACGNERAQMVLTYSPGDAKVTVDGYSPDTYQSPHTFEFFKPGQYKLEVSSPGYQTVTMMIDLKAGETLTQEIHLVKKEPTEEPPNVIATAPEDDSSANEADPPDVVSDMDFRLVVESTPSDASVTIRTVQLNSVLVLKTPAEQLLRRHVPWQVEVQKSGYKSVHRTVVGPSDQEEVRLNVTLEPERRGDASPPSDPPPSTIAIDPQPVGTPIVTPVDPVPTGLLSVNTTPWTVVSVNGKVIGNTPIRNHQLRPGTYKILMENRDLSKRKVQTVTIAAGGHVRLDQEL